MVKFLLGCAFLLQACGPTIDGNALYKYCVNCTCKLDDGICDLDGNCTFKGCDCGHVPDRSRGGQQSKDGDGKVNEGSGGNSCGPGGC